jgi:maleate cis-trans isomerase
MNIISPWYQLGYIIPHAYTDMDAYQFYRVAPEGMMLVTTGLNFQGHSLEAVEAELPLYWQRVDLLAKKKVDRIALSGVPVASFLGRKRMLETLAQAEDRSGIPCDTDLEAHIAVLKHLGATKIALATRWHEATTSRLTAYLAEAGIEVVANCSRGSDFARHKSADPHADQQLALELGGKALREAPQAQAVLMPGGLWHAIHAVPLLEAEHGRPVLLNILSTTWAALHAARKRILQWPDPRWGKVLASV